MRSDSLKLTMSREEARSSYGGVTPKVIATVEGETVMIKGAEEIKESFSERFAYKLGKALGLQVNRVKLIDTGHLLGLEKICSVHWWENDFKRATDTWSRGREKAEEEKVIMNVFDIIIENSDRHAGNYGYLNNELFLIDNGFAHPWNQAGVDYIEGYIKKPEAQKILEKFLSLTKENFDEIMSLPENLKQYFPQKMFTDIHNRMSLLKEYIIEKRGGIVNG